MKKSIGSRTILIQLAGITCIFAAAVMAQAKKTDSVNPMVGTAAHGHTYPGASLPHGMVQLSPDGGVTGWDWCSGYHYSDSSIIGFSHTHLSGTGCADYGDILFMPTTGALQMDPGPASNPSLGYRSRFSHKNEIARPGYYSVLLDDHKIKAELTVTRRAGFHKYTFPKSDTSNVIIDLVHGIEDLAKDARITVIDNKTIAGYRRSQGWANNHCVYFYAEFSKPFTSYGVVENGVMSPGKATGSGAKVKAYVRFATRAGESVLVKVGISHSSAEGAQKNVKAEITDWNFAGVVRRASAEWEQALSALSIDTPNRETRRVFYTALYHALLNPNTLSDVDGSYIGMDRKMHTVPNGEMYSVFSLWDTFRSTHPLFTIIEPARANDMVRALVAKSDENGLLPVWELASNETGTMIGNHAIPVIADAYFKGLRGYDVEKAFEAMKRSAMTDRLGIAQYRTMGYIPSDLENESVSKTLEYAYDDWCIARMAKDLGKMDDYRYFIERAKFYSNMFDPSTSLMRPKKNGRWFEPFDPYSVSGNYTEANAWQYSFFVPQDVMGLKSLMGGDAKFIAKLDELFTTNPKLTGRFQSDITGLIGQYAHGNEPSHHMAYLYNYAGVPWKTAERVHEILTTLYSSKADGLCGNEDCGQMSSWYVMSSLGFYPVCPGDNTYIIGSPLFEKATIRTGNAKTFTVAAHRLSAKNIYIQSATLNGAPYAKSYITHSDLMNGGTLTLEMGPRPSAWGSDISARPVSAIDVPFVQVPFLTSGERVFRDSITVAISSIDPTAELYYTADGSDPLVSKISYTKPIIIRHSTQVKAVCAKNGVYSKTVTASFNKIPEGRSITLKTAYHHSYTGGGPLGLIDSIRGTDNFHTDAWQGYEGNDLDAVIDLGKVQTVSSVTASFLQNTGSWIFYPSAVEYSLSVDGTTFKKVYEVSNPPDESHAGAGIREFEANVPGAEARFVRVYAKNVGICPAWHIAAGGKAWLFVDEISIK
ncbi:MAG TPA: GH92 family glycosyl hydrolase [Bacteroidota bacterium]|nr:GH92 family glycosyl hydrolase [Bacteroidota bacterium]